VAVIGRLASSLGRNDGVPNVELAADVARKADKDAVRELIGFLGGKDRAVQEGLQATADGPVKGAARCADDQTVI
jgi:hypothetical protein